MKAAAVDPRDARRRELAKRTKTQLVGMASRYVIGSAHPLSKWTKDEVIAAIVTGEFPEAAR